MPLPDLLVWLAGLAGVFLLVRKFKNLGLSYPKFFWWALAVWHFALSGLAVYYVLQHGGDALGYWNLTADTSQQAFSWMEHWGYSTFFVQWLNYLPSKVLGLHFFTGTFLYALLSLSGFFLAAVLAHPFYSGLQQTQPLLSAFFLTAFFLPSLHFWSGLIGKEALIWFLVFSSLYHRQKDRYPLTFLLAMLTAWIRPVVGILLLAFLLAHLVFSDRLAKNWRIPLFTLGLLGFACGFYLLIYITHLESFSWDQIRQFSEGQYSFLSGFQAGSEIPVRGMNLAEILFAATFRPVLGEMGSIWGLATGLENLIFLLISLGWFGFFFKKIHSKNKLILGAVGFGLVLAYLLSIALSVNVLGVMVRLKMIAMPFLVYVGFMGWSEIFGMVKSRRIGMKRFG